MVQRFTLLLIVVNLLLTGCGGIPATIENKITLSRTPTLLVPKEQTNQPSQTVEVLSTPVEAYPVSENLDNETPVPYPVQTDEPFVTQNTEAVVTPTLTPLDGIEPATWEWDDCRKNWIDNELTTRKFTDFAGLVFYYGQTYGDTLWKIDTSGQPVLLSCIPHSILSPKGDQVIFRYSNDFWLANLVTGTVDQVSNKPDLIPWFFAWSHDQKYIYYNEADSKTFIATDIWVYDTEKKERRQVTFSPDINKGSIEVWPKYSDWIIYGVRNEEPESGIWNNWILAAIDETGDKSFNDSPIWGWVSFSPDGEMLTYVAGNVLKLQRLNQEPSIIRIEEIGVKGWKLRRIAKPIWSPNGTKLAVDATAWNETGEYNGVVIFDPKSKQGLFVHPFTPVGSGGAASGFEWSPNSQWLAYLTKDENFDRTGLWILRADGSEEHYIGPDSGFQFSPKGDQMLFYKNRGIRQIWNYDLKTTKSSQIDLPELVSVLRWDNR